MCEFWYDKNQNLIKDINEWGKLHSDLSYKILKQTTLPNGKWVSTVWLGMCHNWDEHNEKGHLIFETMVFTNHGDYYGEDCERYSTEEEALNGHYKMCLKYSPLKASKSPTMQKKKHPKQMNKKPVKKTSKKK